MVDCDGPVHLGGWALDFGGPTVGATDPHAALETFLDTGLFGLPRDGYQLAATESGRALFTDEVGRSRKVAVIVADGTIAYLVTDDRVEAWPSTRYPVGCA